MTAWHRTLPVKQPNYKLIFIYYYSNTYFIQILIIIPILILFKYLFYSNTFFIQILFLFKYFFYSNTYFIQILILFQYLLLFKYLFLFKYFFYSNTYFIFYSNTKSWWVWWIHVWIVDEVGKVENLPSFSQTFQIYPSMGDFIILGAGFPTFPTSFSISIEYTILFSPCKNNNNNNNNK